MTHQLLRLPEVIASVKKSRASIYNAVRLGEFPPPIRIGIRSVAWRRLDIDQWLESRPSARLEVNPTP